MWTDIRFSLRQLSRELGFTVTAVLTLALGIAVNATMFSLVSAFLLPRLPGRDSQHIIVVTTVNPSSVYQPEAFPVSAPNYLAWRKDNNVFEEMAAADEYRTVSLTAQGQPEALRAAAVSSNYFGVFGSSPILGRSFLSKEEQAGNDHVVILSHGLWKRRFGSDPAIIGRTVSLNRESHVVIGVMPEDFRLLGFTPQIWIPLVLSAADESEAARENRSLYLFTRLKPGVTLGQARAELTTLAQRAQRDFPKIENRWGAAARELPDFLAYSFGIRPGLAVLMATVGFVLLIACANVACLLLMRAARRQKELAIRLSLGAGRWRIVRQLLTEGLVIAVLGGSVGLLLSFFGIRYMRANMTFNEVISAVPLTLDSNVLLFVIGVSLVSSVLSGLAPALKASRTDINICLKSENRTSSASRSQNRLQAVLVISEIALALFLLIGTGLLTRGLFLIEHQNLGFRTDHLLTAKVKLDEAQYKDDSQRTNFVHEMFSRLSQLPGVEAVAAASRLPATGPDVIPVRIEGQVDSADNHNALDVVVTTDYFRVVGVPLLHGRTFTKTDKAGAPQVVVVNKEFVDRYFKNKEPLGKQIQLNLKAATPVWAEIVGVVDNVKSYSEETRDDPQVYEPFLQRPLSSFSLMLRTTSEPNGLIPPLRQAVAQLDAELPLARVMSMDAVIESRRNGSPFFTRVLISFALLALVLASIGIYGLIAYSVAQRIQEIGIRLALGATRAHILRMVLIEGVKMTAIGSTIGLFMALPLPKVFGFIFDGLHVNEPRLYILVAAIMLIVTILATYIPARRASLVDPGAALRNQ